MVKSNDVCVEALELGEGLGTARGEKGHWERPEAQSRAKRGELARTGPTLEATDILVGRLACRLSSRRKVVWTALVLRF